MTIDRKKWQKSDKIRFKIEKIGKWENGKIIKKASIHHQTIFGSIGFILIGIIISFYQKKKSIRPKSMFVNYFNTFICSLVLSKKNSLVIKNYLANIF